MKLESTKEILKKNTLTIISVFFGITSIIGSFYYVYINKCEECDKCEKENIYSSISLNEKNNEVVEKYIKVDVKGAVKKTGVYTLLEGSTVNDAIEASGGLSSSGVTTNINLSKKVHDEMVIYVFNKNELKEKETNNSIVCEIPKCECETLIVDKEICTNDNTTISNKLVSINTANIEELMTLDGIGESKAKAIIEYRNTFGNFSKIEDLMNVSGIGEKAFESIKNKITV